MSIGMYRPSYSPNVTNTPEEAEVLQGFADFLESSDSPVSVFDEVQRIKFKKNFW